MSSGQNARANVVYQSHQSALVTTARMENSFGIFRAQSWINCFYLQLHVCVKHFIKFLI